MADFQFVQNESEMNIPKESPAGFRVLVVDDSPTFQSEIEERLQNYCCIVTKCSSANAALDLFSQPENSFDIVLVDADLPDMDASRLHSYIADEMDLPIIMMSADDETDNSTRCAISGASDYLIKPISDEALNNIFQHGLRKRSDLGGSSSRKRKDGDKLVVNRDDNTSVVLKKQRMVWSPELRQKFIGVVNQLGVDRAVPKKILEMMNVSWLTRENVASHLQKYRLQLKRDVEQTQSSNMPSSSSDMVMPVNDQRNHMSRFNLPPQQQQVQHFHQRNLHHHVGSLKEALNKQFSQQHSNEAYLSGNQFPKLPFEQSMLPGGNGIAPFSQIFELPSNIVPYNYTSSNNAISGQQNQHVQNPNVAQQVRCQNGVQHVQNQNVDQHLQSQNGFLHVQNQNVAQHLQSQNGFQHVQNQNVARYPQNQNVAQHPISFPLDYSVGFKLKISQNPNSETALLQQSFDHQELMNSHLLKQGSFCAGFD